MLARSTLSQANRNSSLPHVIDSFIYLRPGFLQLGWLPFKVVPKSVPWVTCGATHLSCAPHPSCSHLSEPWSVSYLTTASQEACSSLRLYSSPSRPTSTLLFSQAHFLPVFLQLPSSPALPSACLSTCLPICPAPRTPAYIPWAFPAAAPSSFSNSLCLYKTHLSPPCL